MGNMNVEELAGASAVEADIEWTTRDALLYHASLGAGRRAATEPELRYTMEGDLQVLPSFALVAGQGISARRPMMFNDRLPGFEVDPSRLLHVGQSLRVERPIPASGSARLTCTVEGVYDKGRAALLVLGEKAQDDGGAMLWSAQYQLWVRGAGGFGGPLAPEEDWTRPDRVADDKVVLPTTENQALIYRLNGDMNPIHVDPRVACAAGLERPLLHGLCSFGMVTKALVDNVLEGDSRRLESVSARFSQPVYPGQQLDLRVWSHGSTMLFEAVVDGRDDVVALTKGTATIA